MFKHRRTIIILITITLIAAAFAFQQLGRTSSDEKLVWHNSDTFTAQVEKILAEVANKQAISCYLTAPTGDQPRCFQRDARGDQGLAAISKNECRSADSSETCLVLVIDKQVLEVEDYKAQLLRLVNFPCDYPNLLDPKMFGATLCPHGTHSVKYSDYPNNRTAISVLLTNKKGE